MGGVMGSDQASPVGVAQRQQHTHTPPALVTATDSVLTDNGHPDHTHARAFTALKSMQTSKRVYSTLYTRSIWCLVLTANSQ